MDNRFRGCYHKEKHCGPRLLSQRVEQRRVQIAGLCVCVCVWVLLLLLLLLLCFCLVFFWFFCCSGFFFLLLAKMVNLKITILMNVKQIASLSQYLSTHYRLAILVRRLTVSDTRQHHYVVSEYNCILTSRQTNIEIFT